MKKVTRFLEEFLHNITFTVCCLLILGILFSFASTSLAQKISSERFPITDVACAADFTLKDLTGREFKLRNYKGQTIFLIFMTTWCRECFFSIPDLKAIYTRYHERGLVMMSINVQETHEKVAAYSKKHNLPYPILLDSDGSVSKRYGVMGVPVKLLIDRDGQIICWNCRSLGNMLEKQFGTTAK